MVEADSFAQKSITLGDSDRRPRTRGWVKAEAERKQQETRVLRPRKPPQQAKAETIATSSRKEHSGPERAKSAAKGGTRASKVRRQGPRKPEPKRPELGETRLTIEDLYPERNRVSKLPATYICSTGS